MSLRVQILARREWEVRGGVAEQAALRPLDFTFASFDPNAGKAEFVGNVGATHRCAFERDGQSLNVRVDSQLAFNSSVPILSAALSGHGLAYVPEDMVFAHIAEGRLQRVLTRWCPALTGYHLYYPSRRQLSPAFQLLLDALRVNA
jgi:DNA-binding transcriptional LysR family regulator